MTDITLTVPTLAETAMTGLRLAAEKTTRRCVWRVEFRTTNPYPQIFRNGLKVAIADVPDYAARFVISVHKNILGQM